MTDKYYYEHQAPEHELLEWYNQHESKIIKAKDKVIKSLKGNKNKNKK